LAVKVAPTVAVQAPVEQTPVVVVADLVITEEAPTAEAEF
jgi:hypothetical protein